MKLIKLLLCEGITAKWFVPSAYGLIESLPQSHPEPCTDPFESPGSAEKQWPSKMTISRSNATLAIGGAFLIFSVLAIALLTFAKMALLGCTDCRYNSIMKLSFFMQVFFVGVSSTRFV